MMGDQLRRFLVPPARIKRSISGFWAKGSLDPDVILSFALKWASFWVGKVIPDTSVLI